MQTQPGDGSSAFGPGGTGGTTAPAGQTTTGTNTSGVPCDVSTVVANNCQRCHGANAAGGAIPLVSHTDWHQASPLYAGVNGLPATTPVYEVAQIRINDGTMPQGGQLSGGDLTTLNNWLLAGAPAATATDACTGDGSAITTDPNGSLMPTGNTTVEPMVDPVTGTIDNCKKPGAFDALTAMAGETCYEFDVHAPGGPGPFTVPTGESYHEWYYAVPWAPGDVWTRYGADFDNLQVLHHFLIFTSSANAQPGSVSQDVLGTTLGTNATLIGGWAVGGCTTTLPADVGGELPSSPLIMVQWHMYNNTGAPAPDNSKVQMCTVPASARPNTAGITFLGTENFNSIFGMGPGVNHFTTNCKNNSGAPITVIGFNPHMHLLGINMKTDLQGAGGTRTIFDMPFQFDYQVSYDIPPTVVQPGDTLITTCSFNNDTGSNVAFGESTTTEMCYQFALSYPAGALNNGAASLIGATNTCW
ncbi:MAG: hypothetical protein OEZ06_19735 [Myxococcales bacterium]|nr:hypothetical protein [Myxococcales bacterium]